MLRKIGLALVAIVALGPDDLLGSIEFSRGQGRARDSQIVKQDLERFPDSASAGDEMPPLARERGVSDIKDAVDEEEPAHREMHVHPEGEIPVEGERFVESIREKRPAQECVCIARPVDHQARDDHDREQREMDPVQPADGAGMLLLEGGLRHRLQSKCAKPHRQVQRNLAS